MNEIINASLGTFEDAEFPLSCFVDARNLFLSICGPGDGPEWNAYFPFVVKSYLTGARAKSVNSCGR